VSRGWAFKNRRWVIQV